MKLSVIIVISLLLDACVYYPKQIEYYDPDCQVKYKKLVLEKNRSGTLQINCQDESCIAALLLIPVQALVAGSIVVAGNTVYWLEKQGQCRLKKPQPE